MTLCVAFAIFYVTIITGCGEKQEVKTLGVKDANFNFKIEGEYEGFGIRKLGKNKQKLKVSFKLSETGKLLELSWQDTNTPSYLTSLAWEANGKRTCSMEIRSNRNLMVSKKISLSYDGRTLKGKRTTTGAELKKFRFSVKLPEKKQFDSPSLIYDPKTEKLYLELYWVIPPIKEFKQVEDNWYFLLNDWKIKEYNKYLGLFSNGRIANKEAFDSIMATSPFEKTPQGLTLKGKTHFIYQQEVDYRLEGMAHVPAYAVEKKKESIMKIKMEGIHKMIRIEISKNGKSEFLSDNKVSFPLKKM